MIISFSFERRSSTKDFLPSTRRTAPRGAFRLARHRSAAIAAVVATAALSPVLLAQSVGSEKAIAHHLAPGEEKTLGAAELVAFGRNLFVAKMSAADGHGRPLLRGDFNTLADPTAPLVFPRNMNRISSPESNSCAGCHQDPLPGGSGQFLANGFVFADRFDYATFDPHDSIPTKGTFTEQGIAATLDTIGDSRNTPHLFGSGYTELLAREMTTDLRSLRNALAPGQSVTLVTKGVHFGTLTRTAQGDWDTSQVEGIQPPSLATTGPSDPPSLVLRPFSASSAAITIRHFTNTAFNQHLGMQSIERSGPGDPDGDGVVDELTYGDVSAIVLFQATLPPPGRVVPLGAESRDAIASGEQRFVSIGCATCHVPCLPLESSAFVEPSPYGPPGNQQQGDAYNLEHGSIEIDLAGKTLPKPRLKADAKGVVPVFVFSDFKVHDLTDGPNDPNREPIDVLAPTGSPAFFAGNSRFLTARLWGAGSTSPYFHHGKFTTLREAIAAHGGEAAGVRANWNALAEGERLEVLEFLKSLRILPAGAKSLAIDEKGKKVKASAFPWTCGQDVPPVPAPH